jgi:hypothetical protein
MGADRYKTAWIHPLESMNREMITSMLPVEPLNLILNIVLKTRDMLFSFLLPSHLLYRCEA